MSANKIKLEKLYSVNLLLTVNRLDFSELNVSESGTVTPICLDMFRQLNSKRYVEETSQIKFFARGQKPQDLE